MPRPKKKAKRQRNVKQTVEVIKILQAALDKINTAINDVDSAQCQLEEATESAREASDQAEGAAEVLRERIDSLKYKKRRKRR